MARLHPRELILLLWLVAHFAFTESQVLDWSDNPLSSRSTVEINPDPADDDYDYLAKGDDDYDSFFGKENDRQRSGGSHKGPKLGRNAGKAKHKKGDGGGRDTFEDLLVDFPKYTDITDIEDTVVANVSSIWKAIHKLSPEKRLDREYINDKFWPQVLLSIRDAHFAIREMDNLILFIRKPSALMDALLRINSVTDLYNIIAKPHKTSEEMLKVRYFELSSAASQMHRFYTKRIRDILRDEPRIGMVALSILNYKGYTWSSNENMNGSDFSVAHFSETPGISHDRLLVTKVSKITNMWEGIRDLLMDQPEMVMKAQYEGKLCEDGETLFNIEPAGLDGPYYFLFYLCLTHIKFYLLQNFAYIYKHIYQGVVSEEDIAAKLSTDMRKSIQEKIDLFDAAFEMFMSATGPSYQNYPGVGACDPEEWEYDSSYLKLTNFIKVFVSKEESLHKAGNCKQTCDLLDATYRPCRANETDCIADEELDCSGPNSCQDYDPPCPPRAYQCQNSSATVTTCPSNRHDRLYEYIHGADFKFGGKNQECKNETTTLRGRWTVEPDILVDTPHYCDVCTCYCFEPLKPMLGSFSIRHISTAGSPSLIKENYIIVGIKFERIDDQIAIRIAEAQALPNYRVNTSTIRWLPIKKETTEFVRLERDLRSFNLDDVVTLDRNRVVTGIKFFNTTHRGNVRYNYLGLQIRTHAITNQGVILKEGKVARNSNSTSLRVLYKYGEDPDGPDDPMLSPHPTLPDSTSNQYVVFMGTSLHKDAAQQTIPFFDSQKVIRKEPKWLKGIGLFHKSRPGFGGFLAFKLIEHQDE